MTDLDAKRRALEVQARRRCRACRYSIPHVRHTCKRDMALADEYANAKALEAVKEAVGFLGQPSPWGDVFSDAQVAQLEALYESLGATAPPATGAGPSAPPDGP